MPDKGVKAALKTARGVFGYIGRLPCAENATAAFFAEQEKSPADDVGQVAVDQAENGILGFRLQVALGVYRQERAGWNV